MKDLAALSDLDLAARRADAAARANARNVIAQHVPMPTPGRARRAQLRAAVAAPAVIPNKTGPRFVDYSPCPMCGAPRVGVEYHGELMSGAKVHQLYAHSEGRGIRLRGQPRCLGAGMRVVFEGGVWKGAPR